MFSGAQFFSPTLKLKKLSEEQRTSFRKTPTKNFLSDTKVAKIKEILVFLSFSDFQAKLLRLKKAPLPV